ncbi:LCP family protein [Roseiflexus sp.]|uniref:LCP family protein n=1 Tax=Roseiflexus sp. TaxID=2562120 RepID=UPI00398A8431
MEHLTLDCREARRLIEHGVSPGSTRPDRRALGFHLISCAACRAYRWRHSDALLVALLETPPDPVLSPAAQQPRQAHQTARLIRNMSLTLAGIAAVLSMIFVARLAIAFAAIASSVGAMAENTGQTQVALPATIPPELAILIPPTVPPPAWAYSSATAVVASPEIAAPTRVTEPTVSVRSTMTVAEEPSAPIATDTALPTVMTPSPIPPTITPIPLRPDYRPGAPTPPLVPLPTLSGDPQRAPPPGTAINVLLLGIDRRPGETFPARADAIIVVRIEPEHRRIALLSLPRDLVAPIPGWGWSRINAAMVYGELNPALGGGVALTRRTISELLSIPIDYTVTIDFTGFIGAIDAIGGVTIDVPVELYDPLYPTMDYRYTIAHFRPGVQHMDGERALMYARIRHMDSDWERMKRQQAVIVAALAQVRERNAIGRLESIAASMTALRGYVTTDIPETQLLGLAWAFRDFTPDQIERYTFDANYISIGAPDDPYAQYALPGAIDDVRSRLLGK